MMTKINSVETKSYEVILATIEVIGDQTGSMTKKLKAKNIILMWIAL